MNQETQNDLAKPFVINLKEKRYTTVYNNINKIFDGNYIKFIRGIQNSKPFLADIFVLLRKYEYFIQKIFLNQEEIGSFDKENADNYNKILLLADLIKKGDKNEFKIIIDLLPKFSRDEIDFDLKEKTLRIEIKIFITYGDQMKSELNGAEIDATGFKAIFEKDKCEKINRVFMKIFNAIAEEKIYSPFETVNRFLNYIENYLPNIFPKKKEEKKEPEKKVDTKEWTQEEQTQLEELLRKYKNQKDVRKKLEKIAHELKTKNLKEITIRYKELVLKNKGKKKKPNQGRPEKEEEKSSDDEKEEENLEKIEDNQEDQKQEVLNPTNDPAINQTEKVNEEKKEQKEQKQQKLDPNNDPATNQTEKNPKKQEKVRSLETTDEIIDEIIRVYNKNYKGLDLSLFSSSSQQFMSQEFTDFIEEEDEENEEEEGENNEEEDSKDQIEKNKEIMSIYLSSSLQPALKPEDLTLLQNILNYGEKYQINLSGLKTRGVALAEISSIKLLLKCAKCQKVAFDSNYQKFSKKENIFYLGTVCPKCENEMFSIFKSEYLHQNNLIQAGVAYCVGVEVFEFLPSTFSLTCFNCEEVKNVKLRQGGLHPNDSHCRKCHQELMFFMSGSTITKTLSSNLDFLEKCQIPKFKKFNHVIKDDIDLDNYVKKFDKVIQEGKPLPDFGTCKHYRQSFRWFRFPCCNKAFPCDDCHKETITSHQPEMAKSILCGFCAFEQQAHNKVCSKCGKSFTKSAISTGYWEGGKGCRNKDKMSSKDSHKFTGSALKTISKRKIKKTQMQQKNK